MVLEALIGAKKIKENPHIMLLYAFIVGSVAIWLSALTFANDSSILSIAFIVVAMVPLINKIFQLEEIETISIKEKFWERHLDMITLYAAFFIGITLCYSFWYLTIPNRDLIFKDQKDALFGIGETAKAVSGKFLFDEKFGNTLFTILSNNLMVLFLAIIFSFVYGSGALFLISWNASVLGVRLGEFMLNALAGYASLGPLKVIAAYLHGLILGLGYLPHGIFEIPGFFVGAIAGGIISILLTKRRYAKGEFKIIILDCIMLFLLSIILVAIGAFIEAYLIIYG